MTAPPSILLGCSTCGTTERASPADPEATAATALAFFEQHSRGRCSTYIDLGGSPLRDWLPDPPVAGEYESC